MAHIKPYLVSVPAIIDGRVEVVFVEVDTTDKGNAVTQAMARTGRPSNYNWDEAVVL